MTDQKRFATAEEFLDDWWGNLDALVAAGATKNIPSQKTRDKFTAVPCECGTESCSGWKLEFRRNSIPANGLEVTCSF